MLKSNLKTVIANLEEFQKALPGAIERALSKEYWLPVLRDAADKTLRAQLAEFQDPIIRTRYEKMLPLILDTISVRARPGSRLFEMWIPAESLSDVNLAAASKYAQQQWTPTGRAAKRALPNPLAEQNYQAARQAILDWVLLEKEWDERDAGKTPEEIADRLEMILGLRPAMRARTEEMDAAAESLRGAIDAWLDGDVTTPSGDHEIKTPSTDPARNFPREGLSNSQARQWLEMILETWVAYFRLGIRDRIQFELAKLRQKIFATQRQLI